MAEKLNENNYFTWMFHAKMSLIENDLWEVVLRQPGFMSPSKIREKETQALSALRKCVDKKQLYLLKNAKTSKEAWDILRDYHRNNAIKSVNYLYELPLDQKINLQEHLESFSKVIGDLKNKGVNVDESKLISCLLVNLNHDYNALVKAIDAWPKDKKTLATVKETLSEEYKRRKEQASGDKKLSYAGATRLPTKTKPLEVGRNKSKQTLN